MNSTPLWVPLVVAVIAVLGTIGGTVAGVLMTQRRSDRREDQAWEREREREREQWAREDQLRTFDQRRDVYVDFYESLRDMAGRAFDYEMNVADADRLPDDWQAATYSKLQQLRLFASDAVMKAAGNAYSHAYSLGTPLFGLNGDFATRDAAYDAAELVLFRAIRSDLGVPAAGVSVGRVRDDHTPGPGDVNTDP